MANTNNSLRIRTNVNADSFINVSINQTYDTFEILSLKLRSEDIYKLHSANYGVIVGRVLANENFGVPNAKISVFIQADFDNDSELTSLLYPYQTTSSKNNDVRYNLLPDSKINDCHQAVGTFPNKTYLLDNDTLIEVFDKYYVYTTRTNNAGDYIICGVPIGQQTIHMDLDLSDCGILSQRPRDFVYKGYTIEQFENPNQFKSDTNLDSLSQIFSQDKVVNVIPFWGNAQDGETIGITRADINISFKFEPTCVFMGSLVADNASNGVSKKCVPTNQMGAMDELTTGEGTIEMIRKTPGGNIEEFQVRGTELIDGNGVWCYQIPMNLDYMMTDEYGNMVPTDDPTKGVPTRARVRFRISMEDAEANTDNYFRAKVLVPHNPLNFKNGGHEDYDYEFGSNTREDSFRDLFWNNVYTVKSYIPRFQKAKNNVRTERFSGIKHCNIYGQNNPMPYNNIRIKLPLMFTILCALIKTYIRIVGFMNKVIYWLVKILCKYSLSREYAKTLADSSQYIVLADGLCPDLENWYFVPGANTKKDENGPKGPNTVDIVVRDEGDENNVYLLEETFNKLTNQKSGSNVENKRTSRGMYSVIQDSGDESFTPIDTSSVDYINNDKVNTNKSDRPDRTSNDFTDNSAGSNNDKETVCLTTNIDYLVSCIEMALAQEYKVINFDFYNDWVNGVIYMPRWMRVVRKKKTFLFGLIKIKQKIKGCMDDTGIFNKTRYYIQQCALRYKKDNNGLYTKINNTNGCSDGQYINKQKCHTLSGRKYYPILGGYKGGNKVGNGGIVHENSTILNEYVYYFKPCEWGTNNRKTLLFANDIVLLGSLNDCSMYGIPQAFKYLKSSTYIMPTNLALTNMDDEAYLYATPDGTICSTSSNFETSGMAQITPSFTNEEAYYSKLSGDERRLIYGQSDGDDSTNTGIVDIYADTIPLTEAAGISWNYTGPGQGEKSTDVSKSLYMPGGHFLGISCFNSETNIKSCINLQRVCEMGSNISQRREEVREITQTDENGEEYKIKYRYFVPTGLISNDEINGDDFRTMFATMNSKRLLCEDGFIDEKTGYPFYKFTYMRNTGFGGELSEQIKNDDSWNKQLTIEDEYSNLTGTIARDINYDDQESGETYTRTLETTNLDYYMFRFGLESLSDIEQKQHFLWQSPETGLALPQYENSFYFYFGLRDGATAFDEFNKQFFSVCSTDKLVEKNLTIGIKTEFDECELTTDVIVTGKDAVSPLTVSYQCITEECDMSGETIEDVEVINGYYSVTFNGLTRGTYIFKAKDGSGTEVQRRIEIGGNNDVDASIGAERFTFNIPTGLSPQQVSKSGSTFSCGYIQVSNVSFNGNIISGTPQITIVAKNSGGTAENYYTTASGQQPENIGTGLTGIISATSIYEVLQRPTNSNPEDEQYIDDAGEEGSIVVFVWSANTNYDVYVWNECDPSRYYLYGTYYVAGVESVDLYLGDSNYKIPYKGQLDALIAHPIYDDGKYWWETIGSDDDWYLRYYLFKRNASGESFTNNVFGANESGTILPTALFGQPEKYNDGNYILIQGISYEDDNRLDGVISDTTYIPTWPTYTRKLFGEMVINGATIGSQGIGKFAIENSEYAWYNGNRYCQFTFDNNVLPLDELIDYCVYGDTIYGYFIGRTDDGKLYYLTYEDGKFKYEGNKLDNGTFISLYPVFYYPVMDRPFSATMYVLDWCNPRLYISSENYSTLADFDVKYEDERFKTKIVAINGLTLNKKLSPASINTHDTTISFTNISMSRLNNEDDLQEMPISTGVLPGVDASIMYSALTYYSFILSENKPETFSGDVITISDDLSTIMGTYISYRKTTNGERANYFTDVNDTINKYYLVNGDEIPNPLTYVSYVFNPWNIQEEPNILKVLGRFGFSSDTKLDVIKEDGTYVQKPGEYVVIKIAKDTNTFSFPYKVNSTTSEMVTKNGTIAGDFTGVTQHHSDFKTYLKDNFDITLEEAYGVTTQSNFDVDDYINTILNNKGEWGLVDEIPNFGFGNYTIPTDNTYVVCIVETNNIKLVRIYPKLINLDIYDSNASTPYLIIIPSGTTGIYN